MSTRERARDRLGRPLPPGREGELDGEAAAATAPLDAARDAALALVRSGRFFEAHEVLEAIWKRLEIPPEDREFWKGLTQVAVGCCHVQRGNPAGAVTLLERGVRRLRPYPSPHRGIDTAAVIAQAERVAHAAAAGLRPTFGPWD